MKVGIRESFMEEMMMKISLVNKKEKRRVLKEERTVYPKYMHLRNYEMLKTCSYIVWYILSEVGKGRSSFRRRAGSRLYRVSLYNEC